MIVQISLLYLPYVYRLSIIFLKHIVSSASLYTCSASSHPTPSFPEKKLGAQTRQLLVRHEDDRFSSSSSLIILPIISLLQIVFQGVRGDGYLSDFALDDISLENNPCGLGMMRFTTINNSMFLFSKIHPLSNIRSKSNRFCFN